MQFVVVFGFIKEKIPYNDIIAFSTTHDPSSSLADSLDRVEIRCKKKSNIMIAIKNKENFFNEIKKRNPHITIM